MQQNISSSYGLTAACHPLLFKVETKKVTQTKRENCKKIMKKERNMPEKD